MYLAASHRLLPSASADPQVSERRDGLGSLVVSPCYAVSGGMKKYLSIFFSAGRFLRLSLLTLDSCCLSRSIGHVRCSSFFLAALVGMVRCSRHGRTTLILPIWRPASSAKALVDDTLLLSPGISRYCYL